MKIPPRKCYWGSNLTTLPEKLLDWDNIEKLNIGSTKYLCDCSMAWMIQKFNNSKFIRKFKKSNIPRCFDPPNLRNVSFDEIPDDFCSKITLPTNVLDNGWSKPMMFVLVIVSIALIAYVFRQRARKLLFQYKIFQNDEEQLQSDFNQDFDNVSVL